MGWADRQDPDVEDLERSLHQVEVEFREGLDFLLARRLATTLGRCSPLRRVSAAPAPHAVRLGFADGLSVIAHVPEGGGLLALVLPLHRGASVLLEEVEMTEYGVEVTLGWGPNHRIGALVTGFDQVD